VGVLPSGVRSWARLLLISVFVCQRSTLRSVLRDDSVVRPGSRDVGWLLVGRAGELKQVSRLLHAGLLRHARYGSVQKEETYLYA
jgi:hypothetical protein